MSSGREHSPQPTFGTSVGASEHQAPSRAAHGQGGRFAYPIVGRPVAVLLATALLGVGCTAHLHSASRENREAATGLAPEDAITVVLVRSPGGEYSDGLEEDVTECIEDALEETHPTVTILSADEFRQVAFPDLTPEEIPASDWSWELLEHDAAFRERITSLDLRYLITVSVSEDASRGNLTGDVDGGVITLMWEQEPRVVMEAMVLDLKYSRLAGTVSAEATDKSMLGFLWVPYVLIFPIPVVKLSFHEGRACDELGERVARFLGQLPDEMGIWPATAEDYPGEIGIWPAMADQPPEETETEELDDAPAKTEEETMPTFDPDATDWSTTQCC